jgi:hypothetical protein
MTVPTRFRGRVAVLPVAAIGVRIARSQVLAICIRVELRAIAGIIDNGLRPRGSCESCHGNSGGAHQYEFHPGFRYHHRSSSSHDIFLSMARAIIDHRTSRPGHIWRPGSESLMGNLEGGNRSSRWRRAGTHASPPKAARVWNSAPRRIGTKPQFSGVGGLRTYISFKYSAFQRKPHHELSRLQAQWQCVRHA